MSDTDYTDSEYDSENDKSTEFYYTEFYYTEETDSESDSESSDNSSDESSDNSDYDKKKYNKYDDYYKKKDEEYVNKLVKNGTINEKDELGKTPLYFACNNINIELLKMLLKNNANIHCHCEEFKRWPLHLAALHGTSSWQIREEEEGEYLIDVLLKNGADKDINEQDFNKKTPLIVAVEKNHYTEVSRLIKNGANVNKIDKYGYTALHYAIQNYLENYNYNYFIKFCAMRTIKLLLKREDIILESSYSKYITKLLYYAKNDLNDLNENKIKTIIENKIQEIKIKKEKDKKEITELLSNYINEKGIIKDIMEIKNQMENIR